MQHQLPYQKTTETWNSWVWKGPLEIIMFMCPGTENRFQQGPKAAKADEEEAKEGAAAEGGFHWRCFSFCLCFLPPNSIKTVLPTRVIGKWSSCLYFHPQAFLFILSPWPVEEEWERNWMGTEQPAMVTPPKAASPISLLKAESARIHFPGLCLIKFWVSPKTEAQ